MFLGPPGGHSREEPICQCRRHKRRWLDPWVGKIPWQPFLEFLWENPMNRGSTQFFSFVFLSFLHILVSYFLLYKALWLCTVPFAKVKSPYFSNLKLLVLKWFLDEFSGSPVFRIVHFLCRGQGFDPWLGNGHPASSMPKKIKILIFFVCLFHVF